MITLEELKGIRHSCAGITEVVDFATCPTYSFWEHVINRYPASVERDVDADYHRIFFESVVLDKKMIKKKLDGTPSVPEITANDFIQPYCSVIGPKPGDVEIFLKGYFNARRESNKRVVNFAEKKTIFEMKRLEEMLNSSSDPRSELKEMYLDVEVLNPNVDGVLFDEKSGLIGVPDVIVRKIDDEFIPYEFKFDKSLQESEMQLRGEVLVVDGDSKYGNCGTAMLFNLSSGEVYEYTPSSDELSEFESLVEKTISTKRELGVASGNRRPPLPLYPIEPCKDCKFDARCDPCRVDAIENLGEIVTSTDPETRLKRTPGPRKTMGLEAKLSDQEIGLGDSRYETARMFSFPSIREYCQTYGVKLRDSGGKDVTDREMSMEEMYSNSYTIDRLLFVMEFGLRPTERMTVDAVAEKLDMSRTSVERFVKIGYEMGWVHERQERKNPGTKKDIFSYRRKKTGEMDSLDAERFSHMRSITMRLLRQNGTSLAAAERIYRDMEARTNLIKVRSGISKGDLDADKSGGWRYFVTVA